MPGKARGLSAKVHAPYLPHASPLAATPLSPSILLRGTRFPVRLKMAALAGGAVLLTLAILVLPAISRARSSLTHAHGDRLLAIARSAAAQLPESITGDLTAAAASRAAGSAIAEQVREVLRLVRAQQTEGTGVSEDGLALDLVIRDADGKFRYLAHGAGDRTAGTVWNPPDELVAPLARGRGAASGLYELEGETAISAATPVLTKDRAQPACGFAPRGTRSRRVRRDCTRARHRDCVLGIETTDERRERAHAAR
jgi:hypothetical protein